MYTIRQVGHSIEFTEKVMTNLDFEELIGTSQVYRSGVNDKSVASQQCLSDNKDMVPIILARKKNKSRKLFFSLTLLVPQTTNKPSSSR